ncbi:hypothetical protein [Cryptosporangium phraense]|uniref:DUF4345 domain-containing protein n=1 Tax=Cryptosporangium phraense TaxID=2593070 RepID=A0A545AGF9_9ACTN|nr:hypothetical protein [Cryptosporangium phraense]TQS40403.1 hypothetical protein FL583_35325 [Cryptosporangium phraense]
MSGMSPTAAEVSLRRVSLALITLGLLDLLPALVLVCAEPFSYGRVGPERARGVWEQLAALGSTAFAVMSLPLGAVILAGGIALLQRRARIFGVISANVAIVPLSCMFVASIPIGIWTMTVLARDDVRALFEQPGPTARKP